MKKQMSLQILFLAILLIGIAPVQAAIKPNVMVSGFSIKEGSAAVGKDFTLTVTIMNTEPQTCAENMVTSLQASFPFIINGVSSVTAGDLCTASTTTGAITTVNFPMKVDPTATGGSYPVVITNSFETPTLAQFSSSSTINVFVAGTPELNAHIINSNPIDVYSGDTATVTVNIENDGSFQAQSVTASIKADSPLDAKWAKSFSSIGLLDSKQSKTADFSIGVPKDAEAKDYKLYLELQYKDENMVSQTKNFTFAFHVKKKALFETSDGSEVLYQNDNSKTVHLTLKNIGTDDAHKVKAKLLPQFPFSTDGSVKYIDLLEPGKSTPLQITVNVDKDATPGKYGLDLLLDFEDAQGNDLQDTATVEFTVQQKSMVRALFIDYWFLWLIALVVIILIIRKKLSGKKKNKE